MVVKIKIENFERDALDSKEVITKCLNYIWKTSAVEGSYDLNNFLRRSEISKHLTLETFNDQWTITQKQYYIDCFDMFVKYKFYFLSYTNHYSSRINSLYKNIYSEVFQDEEIKPEDLVKNNLLARAIAMQLSKQNIKNGFFDRYSIRKGDTIEDKAVGQAKESISLIQLISSGSLEYSNLNWSFEEFKAYYNSRKEKTHMLFFILEENVIQQVVHPDYDDWKKEITKKLSYKEFFIVRNSTDFDTVIREVVNSIDCFNTEIVNSIPD